MRDQVHIIVLCEDSRHRQFIVNYLGKHGFGSRKIRLVTSAKGSAEQWVRNSYSHEVKAIRQYVSKNKSETRWLVVMIDADNKTVDQRLDAFSEQLKADSISPRRPKDKICILVPKRNIETWAYYLLHEEMVSEDIDYKNEITNKDIVDAARILATDNQDVAKMCPDSLNRGLKELVRLIK